MTRHSLKPKEIIFVKSYRFSYFAKNVSTNVSKSLNKNVSGNFSLKLLYHAKQPATDVFQIFSKRVIQKEAEATGDLIGNKIADNIVKVLRNSQQNNSNTVANGHDKEITKEINIYIYIYIYISRIDELRII